MRNNLRSLLISGLTALFYFIIGYLIIYITITSFVLPVSYSILPYPSSSEVEVFLDKTTVPFIYKQDHYDCSQGAFYLAGEYQKEFKRPVTICVGETESSTHAYLRVRTSDEGLIEISPTPFEVPYIYEENPYATIETWFYPFYQLSGFDKSEWK